MAILTEKQYQHFIMDYLKKNNGYIIRNDSDFDRYFAMDKELLFKFLNDTQPKAMDRLQKIYKSDTEDVIVNYINNKIMETSLIEVLKTNKNIDILLNDIDKEEIYCQYMNRYY